MPYFNRDVLPETINKTWPSILGKQKCSYVVHWSCILMIHLFLNLLRLYLSYYLQYLSCSLTTVMTMRTVILRDTRKKLGGALGFNRLIHSVPQPPPLAWSIDHGIQSLKPVLPEFSSPTFTFGGSMELMAVPKRKVRYLTIFITSRRFGQMLNFTDWCVEEKWCECNDLHSVLFF